MLTLKQLTDLGEVIKWNTVFCEAGLNPNTMRSAIYHGRELREEESLAILNVLQRHGLIVQAPYTLDLFSSTNTVSEIVEAHK